jgi:hypothetical protein
MAEWIVNLLSQRGFSFGSGSVIELGQAELADYFATQPGLPRDRESLLALMEDAAGANAGRFHRRENAEGVSYWATKGELAQALPSPAPTPVAPKKEKARVLPPPAPAPAAPKKKEKAPAPAAEATKAKRVERAAPPAKKQEVEPAEGEDLPVTRQYQLAVLQALSKLGGRGKAAQVISMIPDLMELPPEHQGTYARGPEGKSEEPKYVKFIHSARRFLIRQGELESPEHGIWAITEGGVARLKDAGL